VAKRWPIDAASGIPGRTSAKALAPYLYPAMKAVEVSGAGGEQLVVEVRKA
jgi:hypothetical protein